MKKKCFQELDLSNAFIFALTMEDPVLCRGVLERILGFSIREVAVRAEQPMVFHPDFRGVRLDVYADDEENTMFNIEMQTTNQGDLPRRSRYHQSQMDVQQLRSGSRFRDLKESYVIFICTFDPFGQGKYRYCFEERCLETQSPLGDGTHKIFLNTEGTNPDEVPAELVWFLKYVGNSTMHVAEESDDELLCRLHARIAGIKKNGEKEAQYMTVEEWLDDMFFEGRAEGRAVGKAEGKIEGKTEGKIEGKIEGKAEERKQLFALLTAMSQDGMAAEIPRLSTDESFFQKMKEKYQI